MRINMPVTNHELPLGQDTMIVSKTDTKGRITYVNRDFIDISGFTETELIGAPHNIVRHPDMPPEAFADLWRSLSEGLPWIGMVKNRCKNGDHYWVEAHAAPMFENGVVTGYISVRRTPTRAQVESAEQAYREFREGRAKGLCVRRGRVISKNKARIEDLADRFSMQVRALMVYGVMAAMMLVAVWLGLDKAEGGERTALIGLGGAGLALGGLMSWWFSRYVVVPLQQVTTVARAVVMGNYTSRMEITRNDEVGRVFHALEAMQSRLGFDLAESRRAAEETQRIKIGLDNVATNVMIADRDYNIIYMNRAIVQMLSAAEADIRRDLPAFNVATLMGSNIDVFHKNPAHQRGMLAGLKSTHNATVKLGGRTFSLGVTPVFTDKGDRIGTAVEWVDRTDEVAAEEEVAGLIEAAGNGDFTRQLSVVGKSGFFKTLAEGLNRLTGAVSAGLADVASVLKAIAQGDLTRQITADYRGTLGQIKADTNATVEQLREVVGGIQHAVEAVSTASGEIASGNADLSSRTEEQASSLEETASSMEELNATVKQNAGNAVEAQRLAEASNEVARQGGEMVREVVTTMAEIQQSSKKIADIISVIDSIAFQTNILALNAAVEAARAGEQGRGFAVVASEVRNLAQRSAQAAREIKGLIADSVARVDGGVQLVEQAGGTIGSLVERFQSLSALVTEIAQSSKEQASGIEQVTQAVAQMESVTQQNAALVEEAAAAAESLSDQARTLRDASSIFTL
ncbi:methyl-accepting chemotaxis protein [Viridibacterium curvum]|uniref:PAS domain S-box protein n=1 Tax=Viridibacterium curvum TaxID=1101404 RepID=A0ABP9Q864_9RHOO